MSTSHHSRADVPYFLRRRLVLVAALLAIVLGVLALSSHVSKPFASAEVTFTDASAYGLAIVPASCPSTPDYAGQCDTSTPLAGQCTIQLSPWTVTQGGPATLSWAWTQGSAFQFSLSYVSGTLTATAQPTGGSNVGVSTNLGPVPQSGTLVVSPQNTTTYTFAGQYSFGGIVNQPFSCDAMLTVTPAGLCPNGSAAPGGNPAQCTCAQGNVSQCGGLCPNGSAAPGGNPAQCTCAQGNASQCVSCPVGYTYQSGTCVFTGCPQNYILQGSQCILSCPAGYTQQGNACIPPASIGFIAFSAFDKSGNPFTASGHIKALPALVRQGETSRIYWNVSNVQSCTVTGNNGDTWSESFSGASGKISSSITGQTTYTLTCNALPGAIPSTVRESVIVNIVPVFLSP